MNYERPGGNRFAHAQQQQHQHQHNRSQQQQHYQQKDETRREPSQQPPSDPPSVPASYERQQGPPPQYPSQPVGSNWGRPRGSSPRSFNPPPQGPSSSADLGRGNSHSSRDDFHRRPPPSSQGFSSDDPVTSSFRPTQDPASLQQAGSIPSGPSAYRQNSDRWDNPSASGSESSGRPWSASNSQGTSANHAPSGALPAQRFPTGPANYERASSRGGPGFGGNGFAGSGPPTGPSRGGWDRQGVPSEGGRFNKVPSGPSIRTGGFQRSRGGFRGNEQGRGRSPEPVRGAAAAPRRPGDTRPPPSHDGRPPIPERPQGSSRSLSVSPPRQRLRSPSPSPRSRRRSPSSSPPRSHRSRSRDTHRSRRQAASPSPSRRKRSNRAKRRDLSSSRSRSPSPSQSRSRFRSRSRSRSMSLSRSPSPPRSHGRSQTHTRSPSHSRSVRGSHRPSHSPDTLRRESDRARERERDLDRDWDRQPKRAKNQFSWPSSDIKRDRRSRSPADDTRGGKRDKKKHSAVPPSGPRAERYGPPTGPAGYQHSQSHPQPHSQPQTRPQSQPQVQPQVQPQIFGPPPPPMSAAERYAQRTAGEGPPPGLQALAPTIFPAPKPPAPAGPMYPRFSRPTNSPPPEAVPPRAPTPPPRSPTPPPRELTPPPREPTPPPPKEPTPEPVAISIRPSFAPKISLATTLKPAPARTATVNKFFAEDEEEEEEEEPLGSQPTIASSSVAGQGDDSDLQHASIPIPGPHSYEREAAHDRERQREQQRNRRNDRRGGKQHQHGDRNPSFSRHDGGGRDSGWGSRSSFRPRDDEFDDRRSRDGGFDDRQRRQPEPARFARSPSPEASNAYTRRRELSGQRAEAQAPGFAGGAHDNGRGSRHARQATQPYSAYEETRPEIYRRSPPHQRRLSPPKQHRERFSDPDYIASDGQWPSKTSRGPASPTKVEFADRPVGISSPRLEQQQFHHDAQDSSPGMPPPASFPPIAPFLPTLDISDTFAPDPPRHEASAAFAPSTAPPSAPPSSLPTPTPTPGPEAVTPSNGHRGNSSATSHETYKKVAQVGEGTYGKVYKARNNETGSFVALKRIRMEGEKEGFPVTAMREIKLLQSLQHVNVIRLFEMMVSQGSVYMVFEYMDHDLTGVLSQPQYVFSAANLKSLCHQMLSGLEYLHFKGVLHRDMKGSNILLNSKGELKLADFGLARFYQKRRKSDYTNRVITLWYRPPELLLGATEYGPEVDMWSAGCIMLEMFTKMTTFPGNDEIHQLETIYELIGNPSEEDYPEVSDLPWYELLRKPTPPLPNRLRETFESLLSPAALDLAEALLLHDPKRRISANDALQSDYFLREDPPMEMPVHLAEVGGEFHELEAKREKAKKRAKEKAQGM